MRKPLPMRFFPVWRLKEYPSPTIPYIPLYASILIFISRKRRKVTDTPKVFQCLSLMQQEIWMRSLLVGYKGGTPFSSPRWLGLNQGILVNTEAVTYTSAKEMGGRKNLCTRDFPLRRFQERWNSSLYSLMRRMR